MARLLTLGPGWDLLRGDTPVVGGKVERLAEVTSRRRQDRVLWGRAREQGHLHRQIWESGQPFPQGGSCDRGQLGALSTELQLRPEL